MVSVFNNTCDLINSMIQVNSIIELNSSCIKITENSLKKLPISCKYYLTIFNVENDIEIQKFYSYMNDDTRTIEFPFEKKNEIDYSMMLEAEQFYNINLNKNLTIKEIGKNIDTFINIVNESNGSIVLSIDIEYLIDFIVKMKTDSIPNHLIDMILYKLSNISEIFILDRSNIIPYHSNLFYLQLEKCMKKSKNNIKSRNIVVCKSIDESVETNVYWNILESGKIDEWLGKIKSPYDSCSYFNLVKINGKEYFVKKISIQECLEKNLFELDRNPGIIIEPVDRFNI